MLPHKPGIYQVQGRPGSDFDGREYELLVLEQNRWPSKPEILYVFTPGFYGDFDHNDFEVIEDERD
jgi:hypothetical protein